jgi:hypothetical protein
MLHSAVARVEFNAGARNASSGRIENAARQGGRLTHRLSGEKKEKQQ